MAINSKRPLADKIALVTGSSRGIGLAIARKLAEEGANILLCGREKQELEIAIRSLQEFGVQVEGQAFDATHPAAVNEYVATISKHHPRLDILVNNIGGVKEFLAFEQVADDMWQKAFDLNFMSMVRFTRGVLPLLRQSSDARIINIASLAGKQPGAFNPHYGASKAAVIHLSKYLANALAGDHIRVNSICPSSVAGEFLNEQIQDRASRTGMSFEAAKVQMEKELVAKVPLGAIATADDIAALVLFLASPASQFVTGTCIAVDGGTGRSVF